MHVVPSTPVPGDGADRRAGGRGRASPRRHPEPHRGSERGRGGQPTTSTRIIALHRASSSSPAAGCSGPASCRPHGWPAPQCSECRQDPREHGARAQHHPRPVGLDERPRDPLQHLGVGHHEHQRVVEALPQLPPPHLHERDRRGPRRRLRHPPDVRGAEVERPTTWATRPTTLLLSHVLPIRGGACTTSRSRRLPPVKNQLGSLFRQRQGNGSSKVGKQLLKDYVVFPALVRARSFLPVARGQPDR